MKTNRQYAIKLTHPEFGVYYLEKSVPKYRYYNTAFVHFFTKKLSKVQKFKNVSILNKKMIKLNNKQNIHLKFDDILNASGKQRMEIVEITKIRNIEDVQKERIQLECYKKELIINTTKTLKLIENFESNYTNIMKNLDKSELISKNLKKSIRIVKSPIQLEIIDASFNFRTLKMKTLQKVSDETR